VVEVELEDLLLLEVTVDLVGEDRLPDLAREGPLRREVERPGDLLGDGAAALDDFAGDHVLDEGPEDADQVEPLVLEETRVLAGDEGLDDHVGDLGDGDDPPVLGVEGVDEIAPVRVDPGRGARAVVLQGVHARGLVDQPGDEGRGAEAGQDPHGDHGREDPTEDSAPAGPLDDGSLDGCAVAR